MRSVSWGLPEPASESRQRGRESSLSLVTTTAWSLLGDLNRVAFRLLIRQANYVPFVSQRHWPEAI